jgi:putative oxidoreductase
MVIQLFVLSGGWPEHILWLSLLTLIIAGGPATISIDHVIRNGPLSIPATAHRAQA